MKPLFIQESKQTPQVILDTGKEMFLIKGHSLPENAFSFYEPIMNWLEDYLNNPNAFTNMTFEFEYFNSSSSKIIFQIIEKLEKLLNKGLEVKVTWNYREEDEDSLETAQTYASMVDIPFSFVKI